MLGAALAAKSRMLHIKLPSRKRFKIRFIILDSETEFRKSILWIKLLLVKVKYFVPSIKVTQFTACILYSKKYPAINSAIFTHYLDKYYVISFNIIK